MWLIIVSLAVGIAIGIAVNLRGIIPREFMSYNSRFQQIGIIILLFSMGAKIGSDKEMIGKLQVMGFKALVFALLTSFFAVLITYFVTNKFLREER